MNFVFECRGDPPYIQKSQKKLEKGLLLLGKQKYSDELKEQIIKECRQIGNTALVARRHNISRNTVYTWQRNARKNGSIKALPKDKEKQLKECKKRINNLGSENDQLKKLVAEKELELTILRELRDTVNPK